jgi:IS5 family transposase
VRKLFGFLRVHRHEIFDDAFQEELESMYRGTGAGKTPVPPAMMAMAVLLQGYVGSSDAEAVELTMVDLRWQMVLDCIGAEEPPFSQGALHDFRHRLIKFNMDRRLLERTVELARRTEEFDPKKLPNMLRVAMDSAPLEGAGRVEDTVNLLGHAARNIVACIAAILDWSVEDVCRTAGIPLLLDSSIKKGLDVEWADPEQKSKALRKLVGQIESLQRWTETELRDQAQGPPLRALLETLRQLMAQDLEPDPGSGGKRKRQGVAPDRRVSIEDPEMRHGRKSKSKRFNGYKRHIASDLDAGLILACAITPANLPEQEAAQDLKTDIEHQGLGIAQLHIDRGYINSPLVDELLGQKRQVLSKPWVSRNIHRGAFTKADFRLNMRELTITCPGGHREHIQPGSLAKFNPAVCAGCELRKQCTAASPGAGRTVSIGKNELLQQRLRKLIKSPSGRQQMRERCHVEHRLAHLVRRQGRRARYLGVRKNLFDVRRAATIQNLELLQRTAGGVAMAA